MKGFTVVGPFSGDHGQGEFARQFREDLEQNGTNAKFVNVDFALLGKGNATDVGTLQAVAGPVLFLLNPLEFLELARQLGWGFFVDRATAGLWWWEAPRLPDEWTVATQLLDEIWGVTEYICDQVRHGTGQVTLRCPLPQAALLPRLPGPALSDAHFLVSFDYRATVERKNPEGALEAYLLAFPKPEPKVALTIKSRAGEEFPFHRNRLHRMARGRPDIRFIEDNVDRKELDGLLSKASCYVSLHRAEGLGLGMLEAMRAGKPVIATAYSGNLQFMPPDYPLLVPWTLAEIPRGTPLYGRMGGRWADPDLDEAAKLMRNVARNPVWATKLAVGATRYLRDLAMKQDLSGFVEDRMSRLQAVRERPSPSHMVWNRPNKSLAARAVLRRLERLARRVPRLHKLFLDVYCGRYSLRRRDRADAP